MEDTAVLVDKLARGLLPAVLGAEATRIAVDLLQQFAVAAARERHQP
jgi:hypothetical protein